MMFPLVQELDAAGFGVAAICRTLAVSRSGYYRWAGAGPSARDRDDAQLEDRVRAVFAASRGTYGAPRIHAEVRMGTDPVRCGRKRIARLMRLAGLQGVFYPPRRGKNRPLPATQQDRVQRKFVADAPNRLWCTGITEHPTDEGKVYCAAVLDVYSRKIVGWAIADHIRAELVVDALDMARWNRKPLQGTIVHSDRGAQYTSWIFGHRLREAGLLGSMGRVASSVDNTMMESFWSSMQRELLDRQHWHTRQELGTAIFEWIEAWYNPRRRHSGIGYHAPHSYEALHNTAAPAT
ncbi:IS3 family transposase [Nakamurella sp. YIM 132087]|uniref:IS3 family transposase n=1 Tax=Nakamurella alba TaxID=2665158 RepID=A0A7K1FP83_9ACTN|nr:IS3 family transposase [Nakamurella alba]MTD15139.1 IS3 family transposase [Nakamurella alba]